MAAGLFIFVAFAGLLHGYGYSLLLRLSGFDFSFDIIAYYLTRCSLFEWHFNLIE